MVIKETVPVGTPDSPTTISADLSQDDKLFGFGQDLTETFNASHGGGTHLAMDHDDSDTDADITADITADTDTDINTDTRELDAPEVQKTLDKQASDDSSLLFDTDDATEDSGTVGTDTSQLLNTNHDDNLANATEWSIPGMFDSDLDNAVQRVLNSDSSVSQMSNTEHDEEEEEEERDGDDASVASNAQSVNSIKSAVQLRLESRTKSNSLTKESLQAKLDAAEQRKLYFMRGVSTKRLERLEKVASTKSLVEERNGAQVDALKKSMHHKYSKAAERKEYFMLAKTSQLREKNDKALSARSILEQQQEEETMAMHEKLEKKMQQAALKKESSLLQFSEKMQVKMSKISSSKDATQSAIQELGKKFAEKMDAARARKELLDRQSKTKAEGYVHERQTRTDMLLKSNNDHVSTRKVELDSKLSSAAERKQALLDDKRAKAAAYLALAYQRGQDALKKKESMSELELQSLGEGEFPTVSLGSIKEDREFDPSDDLIEKLALEWLNDENSVSSFSNHGNVSKSKAQLRLEKYERPAPSKSQIDAKLEAASSRRDLAISSTLEKANTQAKMEKTDLKIRSYQLNVKQLSDKFNKKMEAASQRKATILESTVRGKAVDSNMKVKKAKDMQVQKDARVAAMQEKLERKLLAALERKDNIISARSSRASTDVSVSSNRGKSAMKQKEMMMAKLRDKSERKLNGASSRRKQLRDLDKQKQEVMMLRREMAKSLNAGDQLESMQKKLEGKMELAHERKNRFLAAKKAKAAEHLFSTSDRGLEVLKEKESFDSQAKTKVSEKLDAAEKRRLAIAEKGRKKRQKANMRRQRALELSKVRKSEREMISGWEEESISPLNEEYTEVNLGTADNDEDSTIGGDESSCANSYDEKRLKAKQLLVNEIRLANEAKYEEMERLTKQIRQPGRMERETSVSAQSFGTIDTNEGMSYDDGDADFSISGLSTVREEENNNFDRKKAQAALALAELDIKLSEIQLMQAILLAEEASLSGKSGFKTSDQSVEDLSRVKINKDMMEKQKRSEDRKNFIKTRAKQFFSHTLQHAKVAQKKAGKTLVELKTKIEKTEMERRKKAARPVSAPGGSR